MQPDTRSKRAWCQWHVTSPDSTVPWCSGKPMCGHRSSIANAAPSCQNTTTGSEPTLVSSWPFRCRSASVPACTSCSAILTPDAFRKALLAIMYRPDGIRQADSATRRKRGIVDRLKRADATVGRARARARAHRSGCAPAPRRARGERLRAAPHAAAGGAGPAADGVGAHRSRAELFPDRHDDLTVELLSAVRAALGEEGLDRVIDARAEKQRAAYLRGRPAARHVARARRRARARARRRGLRRRGRRRRPTATASSSSSTTARSARPRPCARGCAAPSSSCSRR